MLKEGYTLGSLKWLGGFCGLKDAKEIKIKSRNIDNENILGFYHKK